MRLNYSIIETSIANHLYYEHLAYYLRNFQRNSFTQHNCGRMLEMDEVVVLQYEGGVVMPYKVMNKHGIVNRRITF